MAESQLSPDAETFSTPPTTPFVQSNGTYPSLSRKGSRPTSLHIDRKQAGFKPDIELLMQSPATTGPSNIVGPLPTICAPSEHASPVHPPAMPLSQEQLNSPCFVHSQLDKGSLLTDWLRHKQQQPPDSSDVGVAHSLQHLVSPRTSSTISSTYAAGSEFDSDDEYTGSLTKKLAETAIGVREMSKQLGRARVQSNMQNVLIITKARDNRLIKLTRELAVYLMSKQRRGSKRGLVVYVDRQLRRSKRFDAEGIRREHPEFFVPFPRRRSSSSSSVSQSQDQDVDDEGQLRYWTSSMCSQSPHLFDFVVTLGGDGTVLFTSWLFQHVVPPVLSFALGSLGFLTNFDFADHRAVMDSAVDNGIRVNLRMRFTCTVFRAVENGNSKRTAVKKAETGEIMMRNIEKGGGWEALEGGWSGSVPSDGKCGKDKEIMCFTTRPVETFEVLNDLVVDRGPSPYVSLLELFGDDHHMTTVQADGLTISTPTGSTAYSLSAGGSLVHPEIPAILITPICPHTLSFRPMLLPDSMELRICVPYNSRSTAWASFDGRGRVELKQGDHIKVTASKYPFPTVCADKQSTDWFHAISRTLKWNERERQKSFVVVEEGPSTDKATNSGAAATSRRKKPDEDSIDDEEDEVSNEEEDTYDIDDSSPENQKPDTEDKLGDLPTKSPLAKRRQKSRSRSRSGKSSRSSGLNSPPRFAGNPPHPPPSRHVEFSIPTSPSSSTSEISEVSHPAATGTRDDLRSPLPPSSKNRLPKDRESELESVKTPTPASSMYGRGRGRSRSKDPEARAFAVWGHDDSSDSTASDSEQS